MKIFLGLCGLLLQLRGLFEGLLLEREVLQSSQDGRGADTIDGLGSIGA